MVEVEENAQFRDILPESRQLNPQNFEQSNVGSLTGQSPDWSGWESKDSIFFSS
jgi:hypothetical protein